MDFFHTIIVVEGAVILAWWVGGPRVLLLVLLKEAFQSQTSTEKILYTDML